MNDTAKFEMHCIVEIFGHTQIAGKVSEQTIAGQGFIRVDVPKTPKRDGFTRLYGPGAIYSMTPVSEEIAAIMAERLEVEAVSEWTLQRALRDKLLTATAGTPEPEAAHGWGEDDDIGIDYDVNPLVDLGDEDIDENGLERDPGDKLGWEPDDPDGEDPDLSAAPMPESLKEARDILTSDKQKAAQWARDLLKGEFVILDTETTGLNKDRNDEPVQIAVIDQKGAVLLDTLVKPSFPIPSLATSIHGITDEMVKDAPVFGDLRDRLIDLFRGKPLVIYNADYDKQILVNAHRTLDGLYAPAAASAHHCAMEQYAQFYGEWNDYHGGYRWQSLVNACQQQRIPFVGKAHSALGDCQATLAVIRKMAEFEADKAVAAKV